MPGFTDLISGYVGDRSQQAVSSTANAVTNTVTNTEQSIQSVTDNTISGVITASNIRPPDCNLMDPVTKNYTHWVDQNNKIINYKVYNDISNLNNTGCICINPLSSTISNSDTSNSQLFKAMKVPNTNNYICSFEKK